MRSAYSTAWLEPRRAAIAGVSVLISVMFLVLTLWAVSERRQILSDRGQRMGGNLAHVLQEQATRSIQAVDLVLAGLVEHLELTPDLPDNDPAFERVLRGKLEDLPYVRALFVIGPYGFIRHDTDYPLTPNTSLADRDYFKAHVDDPARELKIGPPLRSRSVGTWFISLSRRVSGPDGTFRGVAVAAVEVLRFESFYRALALGPDDSIGLYLRDGRLLLRTPHNDEQMEHSYSQMRVFREFLPKAKVGTYRVKSRFDQLPRLISFRALDQYPVVVVIALAEEALLAPWRRNTIGAFAAGLVIAAVLIVLTTVYLRDHRRYEAARERRLQTQKLEALGQMTGGIAHDFNNLLAVVQSGVRVMRRSLDSDPASLRDVLDQVADAVDRGTALCSQLLMFAKHKDLEVEDVDLNARLSRLGDMLRQAVGPRVKIVSDFGADLWPCRADPIQLDAAILNLVVNARDAMPNGGRIELRTRNRPDSRAGDCVEVSVADTGQGMPPDVLHRALEPFYSTKGHEGTGLGLSQVYGFVRQVGGDVKIESEVGVGTTVRLLFALAQRGPAGRTASVTPPSASPP
jgi:signal transduction histidine kinase